MTAWDPSSFSMDSWISRRHTLTTFFSSTTFDHSLAVTNVYAPADHRDSRAFLEDLLELLPQINHPWLLAGDFNLVRSASEKNNGVVHPPLVSAFNDTILALGVDELPLLGRHFTRTNG